MRFRLIRAVATRRNPVVYSIDPAFCQAEPCWRLQVCQPRARGRERRYEYYSTHARSPPTQMSCGAYCSHRHAKNWVGIVLFTPESSDQPTQAVCSRVATPSWEGKTRKLAVLTQVAEPPGPACAPAPPRPVLSTAASAPRLCCACARRVRAACSPQTLSSHAIRVPTALPRRRLPPRVRRRSNTRRASRTFACRCLP